MELRGPYEPGRWNYSIIVGPKELHQNCVLVVHLNLKHEAIVQGFLDEKSSLGSIKGNQTQAVKVFGYLKNGNEADTNDIRCDVWFPNSEKKEIKLYDNGLLSKDI